MEDLFAKYWQLPATIISVGFAFWLGLNRNSWAIDQFKTDLADLKKRVQHLETQGQTGAQTLAGIAATLGAIQETLREIKGELRGKADK